MIRELVKMSGVGLKNPRDEGLHCTGDPQGTIFLTTYQVSKERGREGGREGERERIKRERERER